VRRQPEQSVLHGLVREHLETFLAEVRERGDGAGTRGRTLPSALLQFRTQNSAGVRWDWRIQRRTWCLAGCRAGTADTACASHVAPIDC